jgi:hypothetical protein
VSAAASPLSMKRQRISGVATAGHACGLSQCDSLLTVGINGTGLTVTDDSVKFPKLGRIKLDRAAYKALCEQVLERDGWTCRRCSERQNLQVHHIVKRSYCRIDASWNLCTLCNVCHEQVERHKVAVIGTGSGVNADLLPPDPEALKFTILPLPLSP